jgi:multiple sugar transport system substrate-binding protein
MNTLHSMQSRWRGRCAALLIGLLAPGAAVAVELNYWLFGNNQVAAYGEVARQFERRNPGITIKITQFGWVDYWLALTTALISDTAPDVFLNHLSRYPELAANGALVDLAPYIKRDGIDRSVYIENLYALWGRGARQYGLPKDWDAIGIFYNRAMLEQAGIDPAELGRADWNPRDGGTFGRLIARLTLDRAGRNGLAPDFDRTHVVQHGLLISGASDGFGQAEWSHFAASTGFRFYDAPWSRRLHYDDPRLAETFRWLRQASRHDRWIVPAQDARQLRAHGLFAARRGALALGGSWMTQWYINHCAFPIGIAPLPAGPAGRKTMVNTLADSIPATARHREEAWRWVKYLASPEAQAIVARHGVVFPAIRAAAEQAAEVISARGVDAGVFLRAATAPGGTFEYPIVERGSDLAFITRAAMDRIFLGDADIAVVLAKLHREVNELLAEFD